MRKLHFVQTDVFSDSPFGGNPVVVLPEPGVLSGEEMQSIARGMSFGEAVFVLPPADERAAFSIRCFTPAVELSYSGHALLGAAYVLAGMGRLELAGPSTEVLIGVGSSVHPVCLSVDQGEVVRVSTVDVTPRFGQIVENYGALASALTVDPVDILQTGLPIQVVTTSLPTVIVPLASLLAVRALFPIRQAVAEVLQTFGASLMLVFARQTLAPANDLHVRVFAPGLGLDEDPASGAANGALAAYLERHGVVAPRPVAHLRSEQGTECGRPSLVELVIDAATDPPAIHVGGRVARSIDGTMYF